MKNVVTGIFVFLTLLVPWSTQAGDLKSELVAQSRYYGVGWQNDGNHWTIELLLTEKGGQVAYPSLECTGKWTLSASTDQRLDYVEQITENIDACVEYGEVALEPLEEGRLLYTWKQNSKTVVAKAVLLPLDGIRETYIDLLLITLKGVEMDFLLPEYFK